MFFFRAKIGPYRKAGRALRGWYMDANDRAICFSLKPPQTYDNFRAPKQFRRRRATLFFLNFRGVFFVTTKSLKLYGFYRCFWVFEQLEKHEFVRRCHQEKGRLHAFMKHMVHKLKRAKPNKNASRVRSVFFVNFRIVKIHWVFVGKSRATRKDEKSEIDSSTNRGIVRGQKFVCSCIIYRKYY